MLYLLTSGRIREYLDQNLAILAAGEGDVVEVGLDEVPSPGHAGVITLEPWGGEDAADLFDPAGTADLPLERQKGYRLWGVAPIGLMEVPSVRRVKCPISERRWVGSVGLEGRTDVTGN